VDIADPVYALIHLFGGGPPPQPPYPDCDAAETAECAVDACAR
jgi:hypothetical protein